MRLRTALNEYKRRRGERFPEERSITDGAFAGDVDRLVHVDAAGRLRDRSYPLSGLGGLDRLRLAVDDGELRWLDDLPVTRQRYAGDTPLVETEYDAGAFTVHQFDLTVGRNHLTHLELRGAVPVEPELVAACTFVPELAESRVGQLVHEGDGPAEGHTLEVYHRDEHDFLTASTGLSEVRGEPYQRFPGLLGRDVASFPRTDADTGEDPHLTPDAVVRAPIDRDGRTARVTLVSLVTENAGNGPDATGDRRADRLAAVRETAREYATADDLRAAARDRAPAVPDGTPRGHLVSADLRALSLLHASSGARTAGPEYDEFYAGSGGYGYCWFRDDAAVGLALSTAATEFGLDADEELLASARFLRRTQDADGSWPHRVWADTGELAPGWANDRIERADGEGPDDQLDQPAAVVTFLATVLEEHDVPAAERERLVGTIADGVAFLADTLDEEGRPRRCQNAWENATGQFSHTAGAYLRAFATVARLDMGDNEGLPDRCRELAAAVFAALDDFWSEPHGRYGRRLEDDELDAAPDASTFGVVDGVLAYDDLLSDPGGSDERGDRSGLDRDDRAGLDPEVFDRLRRHVTTTLDELHREAGRAEGLIRTRGDGWRTAGQNTEKVWSLTTLWGARTTAALAERLEGDGKRSEALFDRAAGLYELCDREGPFANDAGLLAEQAFDDGTLDSATPLGWSHALRLETTARLSRNGELPAAHDRPTGPEGIPRWTSGAKHGLGTVADHDDEDPSRVWFTLSEGALTEARFPRIDVMNLRTMDVLVADPASGYTARTYNETRRDDDAETIERTTEPVADDALSYRQTVRETGDGHGHRWTLTVEYAVDPEGDAVVADLAFETPTTVEYDVYLVTDAAVTNDGTDDRGERIDAEGVDGEQIDGERVDEEQVDGEGIDGEGIDGEGIDGEGIDGEQVNGEGIDGLGGPDEAGPHLVARNAEPQRDPDLLVDADGERFDVALAVTSESGFDWATAERAGTASLSDLFATGAPVEQSATATGNVVLVGRIGSGTAVRDTVALGFAEDGDTAAALGEASGALSRGFPAIADAYARSWRRFLDPHDVPASVSGDEELEAQYRFALMTLAALEDKTYPGAGIASPSVPWGETETADRERGYGYNFVWSRDLYQVFTVLDAVGLHDRAVDALGYLYTVQQDDDGFLPQNTYVDGRTRWGGEQMDNIAYPAVMAHQLYERGYTFAETGYEYEHVRRSTNYVARNGPETGQERWEEESGYSPSTIAAEIAGLASAGAIAIRETERLGAAGDDEAAADRRADAVVWLALADDWADRVVDWTATGTGVAGHDRTPYFVRVTRHGDPESGHDRTLANDGSTFDEREILDAGFLELVRLGVFPADDPVVRNSVAEVDDTLRVDTPHGPAWYRYVGDTYGELQRGDKGAPWHGGADGKGRLWPIFTGERAEYELRARGDGTDAQEGDEDPELAPRALLWTMTGFANDGRMLPEQVWDRADPTKYNWGFGEGTGAATPLAWSMAGFVRLAHGVDAGEPVETPAFVRERYVETDRGSTSEPELDASIRRDGRTVAVTGETSGGTVAVQTPADSVVVEPDDGRFEVELGVEQGNRTVIVAAAADADRLSTTGTCVRRFDI